MKSSILLMLFTFLFLPKYGQAQSQSPLILINSKEIEPHRYDEYKGSPYIFSEFVKATIISEKEERIEVESLNYNAYSHHVEVRYNSKFVELNTKDYIQIEIPVKGNKKLEKKYKRNQVILHKSVHPSLKNKFSDLLYKGKNCALVKELRATLKENKVNSPGDGVTFKRFSENGKYYLITDDFQQVRLTKKQLIKTFGFKKEIEQFISDNKTDFKSDVDIIKLMKYYDELLDE